jgi:hypothetical protein
LKVFQKKDFPCEARGRYYGVKCKSKGWVLRIVGRTEVLMITEFEAEK